MAVGLVLALECNSRLLCQCRSACRPLLGWPVGEEEDERMIRRCAGPGEADIVTSLGARVGGAGPGRGMRVH